VEYSAALDLIQGSFASEASQLEASFEERQEVVVAWKREGRKSLIDQIEEEIAAEVGIQDLKEAGAVGIVELAVAEIAAFAEIDFGAEIGS